MKKCFSIRLRRFVCRLRPRISTSTSTNFELDFDEFVLDFDDFFHDFDKFGLKLIFGHMKMMFS